MNRHEYGSARWDFTALVETVAPLDKFKVPKAEKTSCWILGHSRVNRRSQGTAPGTALRVTSTFPPLKRKKYKRKTERPEPTEAGRPVVTPRLGLSFITLTACAGA